MDSRGAAILWLSLLSPAPSLQHAAWIALGSTFAFLAVRRIFCCENKFYALRCSCVHGTIEKASEQLINAALHWAALRLCELGLSHISELGLWLT